MGWICKEGIALNVLGFLVLYGWILLCVIFFSTYKPQKAIILSVFVGYLFLPAASIPVNLPGIAEFTKRTSISFGIIIGSFFIKRADREQLCFTGLDWVVIAWCGIVPFLSSMSNGLGIKDAFSSSIDRILNWGTFFWFGRKYFGSPDALKQVSRAVIILGLVYSLLCLFELRMSPQLSNMVYGFFPHSFLQHIRGNGYRPIVFLNHGLLVSLWMSFSTVLAYSYSLNEPETKFFNINIKIIVIYLAVITVLTKTLGSTIYMFIGLFFVNRYYKKGTTVYPFLIIAFILIYSFLRINGFINIYVVQEELSNLFPPDRVYSLMFRLRMEDLMLDAIRERILLGWGWIGRGLDPQDFAVFNNSIIFDSYFIIFLLVNGVVGFISLNLLILSGPVSVFMNKEAKAAVLRGEIDTSHAATLSLLSFLYAFDFLLNAPNVPVFILIAGALLGFHVTRAKSLAIAKVEAVP